MDNGVRGQSQTEIAVQAFDRRTLETRVIARLVVQIALLSAVTSVIHFGAAVTIRWPAGWVFHSKSEWKDQVTLPKGGRARRVPMTKKLAAVLQAHHHLRGPRVLYRDNGTSTSKQTLSTWMISAQRRAGLKATGNKHILRDTFCSRLAMRGATLIAIK